MNDEIANPDLAQEVVKEVQGENKPVEPTAPAPPPDEQLKQWAEKKDQGDGSPLEEWDQLSARIAELREVQDGRLSDVLTSLNQLVKEGRLPSEGNNHASDVYLATQGDQQKILLAQNRDNGSQIIVDTIPVLEGLNISDGPDNLASAIRAAEDMERVLFQSGHIRFGEIAENVPLRYGLIAYTKDEGLSSVNPQTGKSVYGYAPTVVANRSIGAIELHNNRNPNREKRVDPVTKGQEAVGLLKEASYVGRFNSVAGKFESPPAPASAAETS